MDNEQNGNEVVSAIVDALKQPEQQSYSLSLPGIEILIRSLSPQDRGIFESDLRTVVNSWLRATGLIKVQ